MKKIPAKLERKMLQIYNQENHEVNVGGSWLQSPYADLVHEGLVELADGVLNNTFSVIIVNEEILDYLQDLQASYPLTLKDIEFLVKLSVAPNSINVHARGTLASYPDFVEKLVLYGHLVKTTSSYDKSIVRVTPLGKRKVAHEIEIELAIQKRIVLYKEEYKAIVEDYHEEAYLFQKRLEEFLGDPDLKIEAELYPKRAIFSAEFPKFGVIFVWSAMPDGYIGYHTQAMEEGMRHIVDTRLENFYDLLEKFLQSRIMFQLFVDTTVAKFTARFEDANIRYVEDSERIKTS